MNGGTPDDPFDLDDFIQRLMNQNTPTRNQIHYRVEEHDDKDVVYADIPGEPESMQVQVNNELFLEIVGETQTGFLNERIRFDRPFTAEDITTTYNNGVLTVTIHRNSDYAKYDTSEDSEDSDPR